MGLLDRLFGRGDDREDERRQPVRRQAGRPARGGNIPPDQLTDEQAVERYRYMLRTAPPETLEQAHTEAFTRLTPEQRQMVLQELTQTLPENERGARQQDDPQSLARMATRAEMRQPGTLERTFGGMGGGGIGMGGLLAGSFLSSFAGMFLGSMIAQQFFDNSGGDQGSGDSGGDGQEGDSADSGEGDSGGTDGGGTDTGGYADSGGGDFGGGDFGGGDFGGGDFGGGDF